MKAIPIDMLQVQILGQVSVALLLGAIIGLDRELKSRPAGMRTHSLVAGGSALFVSMGHVLINGFDSVINMDILRSDPIRLIEAVITGISFLGAGTIIREKTSDRVRGLTTAATILVVAAVGVSVALHQYVLAIGMTGLVWLILRGLRILESRLGLESSHNL